MTMCLPANADKFSNLTAGAPQLWAPVFVSGTTKFISPHQGSQEAQ